MFHAQLSWQTQAMFLVLEEIRNIAEGHQAESTSNRVMIVKNSSRLWKYVIWVKIGHQFISAGQNIFTTTSQLKLGQISKKLTFRNMVEHDHYIDY